MSTVLSFLHNVGHFCSGWKCYHSVRGGWNYRSVYFHIYVFFSLRKGIWVVLPHAHTGVSDGGGWRGILSSFVFSWPLLPCWHAAILFQSLRLSLCDSICQKEVIRLHGATDLRLGAGVGWDWGEAYSCYTVCMQDLFSLSSSGFLCSVCLETFIFQGEDS